MAWGIYLPILGIALVLGIISISKGHTSNGVLIVLASLIVVPFFIWAVTFGYPSYVERSAAAAAMSVPATSVQDSETASDTSSGEGALSSVWGDTYNASTTPPASEAQDYSQTAAANAVAAAPVNQTMPSATTDTKQTAAIEPKAAPLIEEQTPYGIENSAFPYPATITDSRGEVVLQSGPGIMSSNIAKIRSGEEVAAASQDGEWIMIRTQDNKMGYVRSRQLEFVDFD